MPDTLFLVVHFNRFYSIMNLAENIDNLKIDKHVIALLHK